MLVDSHCHLDFPDFADELDGSGRARAGRRRRPHGDDLDAGEAPRPGARRSRSAFDDVFCSVGTHPHNAARGARRHARTIWCALPRHPKVVAIGEAGLDYHYDKSPRDAQEQGFRTHIAAARETGLPLVIHAREADDDMARILEEETGKGAFPAVLHCFTVGPRACRAGIALGLYVSFSGILTFKNSDELRAIAADAAGRPHPGRDRRALSRARRRIRGKRNEPAYVVDTAKVLAETRGVTLDEIARQTTDNFFRLFTKVPRPRGRR